MAIKQTPQYQGERLFNIVETSEVLGLSRSQTYALAASGVLPVVRFGRSVRVPSDGLAQLIKSKTQGGSFVQRASSSAAQSTRRVPLIGIEQIKGGSDD
jgi:excisionase family DNA binding protein